MIHEGNFFLIIFFLGLFLTAAVNVIIDPAYIFKIMDKEGINHSKTEIMRGGGRRDKAMALKLGVFDTVILGSSRAEVGIDPESPVFGASKVYNAALPFTDIFELYNVFKFVKKKPEVKRIIIGLDYPLFTASLSDGRADFNLSLFAVDSPAKIINNIFSIDEFTRSIDTLRDNLDGKVARHSKLGHRYKMNTFEKLHGHRNAFNDKLTKGFRLFIKSKPPIKYHPERLKLLSSIIKESEESGIELMLFISPTHVHHREILRVMSLSDDFVIWKRDLTNLLSKYPKVELWDFSGVGRVTTETIPPAGDATTKMRWYWESSHYKSVVGDLVLKRLFNIEIKGAEFSDFGILINTDNIKEYLAGDERAQEKYRSDNPKEIAEIEELWKKANEL